MKVIVTMAGDGTRFKQQGVDPEKYRLQVRGQTMFEYAMQSLEPFFDSRFIFVTRESHKARNFVNEKCEEIGIMDREVVELKSGTSGQATTALKAGDLIEESDAIAIYNIDTYVEPGHLTPDALNGDGCIPVFKAVDEGWSFCKLDAERKVTKVSEKEVISEYATLGLYYFNEWRLFEQAFEERSEAVESEYGERYIAPLYNWLIDRGYDVTAHVVPKNVIHVLGTPDEVSEFDSTFADRYELN